MRLAAAAVTTILAALGATAATAQAARFTAEPPKYVQSGAGPFEWRWTADDPANPVANMIRPAFEALGATGYWKRCSDDESFGLSNLAEGRYSVSIADDPDPCWEAFGMPTTPQTTSTLIVDATPPTINAAHATLPRFDVRPVQTNVIVRAGIDDPLAGVGSVTWTPGDGSAPHVSRVLVHPYPPGTWNGTVTAVDRAGNSATRPFTVTVPKPPAPYQRPRDRTGPYVEVEHLGHRVLGSGGLGSASGCSCAGA